MPRFIPCPGCEQHVKLAETTCPHCGARLRDKAGNVLKTATAAMLGLVAAASSCSDSESTEPVAEYGPAPTVNAASTTGSSMGGAGGTGGAGGMGGEPVAEYGPSPTVGPGGGAPGGSGGTGGAGGSGGN